MAFPLTEEQKRIVDDRGGELLVSAAAGSGKTRVLVERLMDRVTREGMDLDQFLVITYTKAAAGELRARIAQELSARLAEAPNDRHLRRQTALVYQAQISTIHAFCAALLRESGHLLDLDPDFRLCDEGEGHVMMAQVLEDVLEEQYRDIDPEGDFALLVDTLSAGRDDSRLAQIVLDVFGRIQSHPEPLRWLEEQKAAWELDGITDVGQTAWGALLLEDAARLGRDCVRRLKQAVELCGGDELLEQNYAPSLQTTLEQTEALCAAADRHSWDQVCARLPVSFPAVGRKRKRTGELSPMEEARAQRAVERVKALRDGVKEQLTRLGERFDGDSGQLLADLAEARPAVRGLMELVARFQEAYQKEKARRGVLDFSDLEHFAVRLLLDPESGQPTPLASSWSARFAEVMVDEYQDTNQVQNAIFTAVSDGGRTLFQVGDVKQSIYRFRLADPTIFLEKYRRFRDGEEAGAGEPRRRVLSRNFRSRPRVLEGCNDLFRAVMSRDFGEVDYTDDQALVPGAAFPPGEDDALELDVLDLSLLGEQEEGEREDKNRLEARWAARRIRALLDRPLMVKDGEGTRPLRPSDVMILLRSPGVVLHHYLRALSEEGIPWSADGGGDLFDTTEVNVALALLQIVDNPRQDVPLIAALRSPVFGFDGDKLAFLRAGAKGDFYTAVTEAAGRGDQACRDFLTQLEELRFGAGERTCRQLIWHIYEQTNLLGLFGAMPGGQERQDNLLALYALAGQLEDSGCRSLFQFLLRLERLRQTGAKLPSSGSGREGEGVSILSIHRSKGLEKPVVLVCGLSRRLNREDLMRPVLFHPVLGVGPKGLDRERMVEYPTLARRAVSRQLEREMMAEELRLLYVAMTRAREKLVLVCSLTGGARDLQRMAGDAGCPVEPQALLGMQAVSQWVLLPVLARPDADALRRAAGVEIPVTAEDCGPEWDIRWINGSGLAVEPPPCGAPPEEEADEDAGPGLEERLLWQYPFAGDVEIPSKLTATQLKGRDLDGEAAEETPQPPRPVRFGRPRFASEEMGLTPAQRGTALHLVMQFIDFSRTETVEQVAGEIRRLVERQMITPQQGEAVRPEKLTAFFSSAIGREVRASETLHREFKFSILVPAAGYYARASRGEEVLLQGVVDCWFETPEGITVLDFKTDRVDERTVGDRAEEYRPQLAAYSRALEEVTGRQVCRRVLWFFALDRAEEVPDASVPEAGNSKKQEKT